VDTYNMRSPQPQRTRSLLGLTICGLALLACTKMSRQLVGDYDLVRMQEGIALCYGTQETVISANIDEVGVYDYLIVGHVTTEGLPPRVVPYTKPGYFVIDTRDINGVRTGLSKDDWLEQVKALGISQVPELSKALIE